MAQLRCNPGFSLTGLGRGKKNQLGGLPVVRPKSERAQLEDSYGPRSLQHRNSLLLVVLRKSRTAHGCSGNLGVKHYAPQVKYSDDKLKGNYTSH